MNAQHADGSAFQRSLAGSNFLFELQRAFGELFGSDGGREVNHETHGGQEVVWLAARDADHLAQRMNELLTSGGANAVGGAFGAAAVTRAGNDGDQLGAQEAVDGVVQRTALENQNLVFVTFAEQLLHLVGMHGFFAEQRENGDFPDSKGI